VESVYVEFGRELQRARKDQRLSQAELALRVDPTGKRLGRTSIANIEAGKQRVSLHLFLELARALKLEPVTLLPEQPAVEPPDLRDRTRNLPAAEQEWLQRVVSAPPSARVPRPAGKRNGAKA
jgi:transcriptional regulator with XRE-family HTH domain